MKKCERCKGIDREFPFTLYGETGKLIKYRKTKFKEYRNKIVCYHCWSMLVYGSGVFYEYDKIKKLCHDSTDKEAFNN